MMFSHGMSRQQYGGHTEGVDPAAGLCRPVSGQGPLHHRHPRPRRLRPAGTRSLHHHGNVTCFLSPTSPW